ncbi:MAG TPA: hypothetical protein VEY67_07270 [Candidatus Dormibacteraeota bacterium]|nr:hypothetical protein [Candidatus Dormibacteraeota bacterium]
MTAGDRFTAYLTSRRNLVGSALGLIGLALFALGVTGGILWLPIVVGLYLAGVLLTPPDRPLDLSLGGAEDVSAVRSGLDRLLRQVRGRIADDLYARVVGIRDSIVATLPSNGAAQGGSERDLFLIRQTALDYLPAALDAYLALPRRYAEGRPLADGRTPHDVLLGQLDLMDRKMAEVADDLARSDTDRLLANGRFLAEKFSTSSLSLDALGSADPAPAAIPAASSGATPPVIPAATPAPRAATGQSTPQAAATPGGSKPDQAGH